MSYYGRAGGLASDVPATNILSLWAKVGTSGQVATFRRTGLTAGYQVTAGTTFYICKISITLSDAPSAANAIGIGYADNDVGMDTATARTNPVAIYGDAEGTTVTGIGGILFNPNGSVSGSLINSLNDHVFIKAGAASKYMYMKHVGGANIVGVLIHGIEI